MAGIIQTRSVECWVSKDTSVMFGLQSDESYKALHITKNGARDFVMLRYCK